MQKVITESDRLIIREFKVEDSPSLMNIFGDEEVMHYGDGIKGLEWVEHSIREWRKDYRRLGHGKWAVVAKDSAALLGYCGLECLELDGEQEVALGYRLARKHWGKGYATEAVLATVDYAFDSLELTRLVATIDPSNIASIGVTEKAGMVYAKEVMLEGYTYPDYLYVLERKRFNPKVSSSPDS